MNVLVIGAEMMGTDTAVYLAMQCKVSIGLVSGGPYIEKGMGGEMSDDLTHYSNKQFVKIMTDTDSVAATP